MSIKQRVIEVVNFSGMKMNLIAEKIDVPQSTFSRALNPNSDSEPKLPVLLGMMELFPSLNPKWLFFGEGEMWLDEMKERDIKLLESLEKQVKAYEALIREKMPELARELGLE